MRSLASWLRPLVLLVAFPLLASSADEERPPADKAIVVVRLPAKASLTIGSDVTKQTGPERTFVSPSLTPGKSYTYELKATWEENGKLKYMIREATVRAGQKTVVDFLAAGGAGPKDVSSEPKSRTFQFMYGATVTGLKPGEKVRVWLPVPTTGPEQEIAVIGESLPASATLGRDAQYGNQYLYFEATADKEGNIPFSRIYSVTRQEVRGERRTVGDDDLVRRFLQPDKLVPIEGKPLDLLKAKKLPGDQTAAARILYDVVDDHMRYSKDGKGWGRGDSVWACDSKYGNCTDFHSLFISLARANKIPAKFEIGFPIPEKRGAGEVGGYHCWAKFKPEGKGWIPVDISEADKFPQMKEYYFGNLTEDRVTFSTGRDLTLVPKQDGEPVNFLIYPYVEVDGKVYPQEKIVRKFSYKDL